MQISNLSRWKRQGSSAHLAIIADEGFSIPARNGSAAALVRAKSAAAKPIAVPAHESREMVMEGGDKKSYMGQQ